MKPPPLEIRSRPALGVRDGKQQTMNEKLSTPLKNTDFENARKRNVLKSCELATPEEEAALVALQLEGKPPEPETGETEVVTESPTHTAPAEMSVPDAAPLGTALRNASFAPSHTPTPPAPPPSPPPPVLRQFGVPLLKNEPPPASANVKPLTVWKPSQFLAHKTDPANRLLGEGYLELGSWTSLLGIGGVFKSRLSLWCAIRQILGLEWCGLPTSGTPQTWLLLGNENGRNRWKSDIERIQRHMTQADFAKIEEHLRIQAICDDDEDDDGGILSILTLESQSRLAATIRSVNPGVIVFDPLGDIVDGDENKTVDMIATLRTLRGIVRRNARRAAVLVVHHARTGKDNIAQAGDGYNAGNFGRGAKALYSTVRCEIQIAPADRDDSDKIVVACGKANDARKFPMRCVVFDEETGAFNVDEDFDPDEWRRDVAGKSNDDGTLTVAAVVSIVKELCPNIGDTVKAGTLVRKCEELGASTRTANRRLREAVSKKHLRQVARGEYALGAKPL